MCVSGCGSSGASAPASTPTVAAILVLNGKGDYTSSNFSTPPSGWKIKYSRNCKWSAKLGKSFAIDVGDANNPMANTQNKIFDDSGKAQHSGTSDLLNGGQWFLKVNTFLNDCQWHITVPKS
jgi:hypothetical protein